MATIPWPRACARAAMIVAITIACAPRPAPAAGSPLDVQGFEPFATGPLVPQFGWSYVNQFGTTQNQDGAVVQTAVRAGGARALQLSRVGGVDSWWGANLGGSLPTQRFMLVDWDMLVVGTGAENGGVGPFFGVESYGYDPATDTYGVLGMFGADATTGEVVFLNDATNGIDNTGQTFDFDSWNSYRFVFDFQTKTYATFLNGSRLRSSPFVDTAPGGIHFTRLADAAMAAIAIGASSPSQAMPGTAYIDNFRVLDGLPGDFQSDGDVDAADLALWKSAFQQHTAAGDADGDGDSDGADFLVWQRYLGTNLMAAVGATAPAPEPAAAALAAVSIGVAARCTKRRPTRPYA